MHDSWASLWVIICKCFIMSYLLFMFWCFMLFHLVLHELVSSMDTHACISMVIFLPIASPKIPTSKKTCFQHLQPKFFQWVHHIYLLALCYSEYISCYFELSIPLNLNAYVIDCYGKSWLKSSNTLLLFHLINMNHCD